MFVVHVVQERTQSDVFMPDAALYMLFKLKKITATCTYLLYKLELSPFKFVIENRILNPITETFLEIEHSVQQMIPG